MPSLRSLADPAANHEGSKDTREQLVIKIYKIPYIINELLDMKAFEINIHKNVFFQTSLSFVELCLGDFYNKIFKIFHPLSLELLKGLVKYEAEINSPVFFYPSYSLPVCLTKCSLLLFWNEFPNKGLREMHTAKI